MFDYPFLSEPEFILGIIFVADMKRGVLSYSR